MPTRSLQSNITVVDLGHVTVIANIYDAAFSPFVLYKCLVVVTTLITSYY